MSDVGGAAEIPLEVSLNEAQVARIASQLAGIFDQAANKIGASFEQAFSNAFGGNAARQGAERINRAMSEATAGTQARITGLANGMADLIKRATALRTELSNRNIDPNLFAVYENALADVINAQEEFRRRQAEFERDPKALAAFEAAQRDRNNALRAELRIGTGIIQQEHGRRIVAEQRELTLSNTTTRINLARQLAAEQASARQRIEIFRFAARQIIFIENQLARALRATAGIIAASFRAGFSGIASIGRALRRNNAEFNEGLQGALTRRERTMSESFNRQNRIIQQQSQTIDRFNKQASTGLFGLLSGRSGVANALGVTGILGGGLAAGGILSGGLSRFTQLERIQIQLDRLTGSADNTRIILDQLVTLAQETPLELTDVSGAAVALLAAGTGIQKIIPDVQALADAIGFTGGGAEQLQRVSLALSQIASKGRLQGEEIRQLAESLPGLNIPKLLADQLTGGDTGLLLKMSEAGDVSAQEFIGAFFKALSTDPRIKGAATATVNTLGGQLAILREQFDILGASVIKALKPLLLFSIQGTTRRLAFLSDLIEGNVSPALQVLRKALIGVAIGISALLVARAAGEALQFMAIGLRAVLTPMGLLVGVAAALGAAIFLLRSNSEAWAAVTQRVGTALANLIPFLDVNKDGFVTLSEVIQGRILPALGALASIAQNVLLRAFQVSLGFIVTFVVPGFRFLADLIVNTLVPGVVSFASVVANRALPVLRALGSALGAVIEFLAPAISGFRDLGGAIVDAFRGDFSNLFGGLRSAGAGIGTVFANIGTSLFNAVRPQVERAVEFISSALGRVNLTALVVSISKAARQVGFIIGNIATDPTFLQALEKIALAGALIAGRFIQGFAEGVASNLPQLSRIFADQFFAVLLAGLKAAFSSPQALLAVITAVFVGPIAVRAFKNIGTNWGKLTSDGFATGLRKGTANTVSGVRAFFSTAEQAQARATARIRANTLRDFNKLSRDIAAVGGKIPPLIFTDPNAVNRLKGAFETATRGMSAAEQQALLTRSRLSNIFVGAEIGARTAAASIGKLFGRNGFTWSDIGLGVRSAKNNIAAGFRDIATDLKARGTSLGQVAGAGILGGIAAAFAGSQGGKAGILGIITAAITTGLATGSPLVGAAVAGVGAIAFALNAGKEKAEAFNTAVRNLAGTFDDLSSKSTIAEDLAQNLANAFTSQFQDIQDQTAILSGLPDGFFQQLANAAVEGNILNTSDAFKVLASSINITTRQQQALTDAFNRPGESVMLTDLDNQLSGLKVQLETLEGFNPTNAPDPAADRIRQQIAAIEAFQTLLGASGISLDQFGQLVGFTTDQVAANAAQIKITTEQQRLLAESVDQTTAAYRSSLGAGNRSADALERTAQAAGKSGNAFLDALKFIPQGFQVTEGFLRDLYNQLVTTGGALLGSFDFEKWIQGWLNSSKAVDRGRDSLVQLLPVMDDVAQQASVTVDAFDLVRSAIDEMNKARTDKINQRIKFLQDQLEGAKDAAAKARDELTRFLTGRFQDTPQRLVDQLIGSLGDIGSAVEDSMIQGGVRGAAGMRVAVGGFEQQLADIIQAGFESGLTTQSQFENLLAPLFSGLDEETSDALARILSTKEFDFGVGANAADQLRAAISRALEGGKIEANIGAIFDADKRVAEIQRQLDFQNAQLNVELVVDAEQVKAALAAAGIDPRILADITGATVTEAQITGLAAVVAAVNAQLNGQPAPGQVIVNQDNQTNINVNGTTNPTTTADKVIVAQGAAAARNIVALGQVGFMRT